MQFLRPLQQKQDQSPVILDSNQYSRHIQQKFLHLKIYYFVIIKVVEDSRLIIISYFSTSNNVKLDCQKLENYIE